MSILRLLFSLALELPQRTLSSPMFLLHVPLRKATALAASRSPNTASQKSAPHGFMVLLVGAIVFSNEEKTA